jgi:5,10-methylenetetrahydromethanopterin reductase
VYWDRPRQQIEVLLSGSGPKTLELAGELGDGAIIVPGIEEAAIHQVVDCVARGSRSAGRDPAAVRIVLWVGCALGPEEHVWRDVAPWVRSVLRHPLAFELSADVEVARERIRESYDFALHMSHDYEPPDSLTVDLLRRFALAGSQSQLAEELQKLAELPVDEIVLVIMGRNPVVQARSLNALVSAAAANGGLVGRGT